MKQNNRKFKVVVKSPFVESGEIVTLISDKIPDDNYACFRKANKWSSTYLNIDDLEEITDKEGL
jgi:hypothetical protein